MGIRAGLLRRLVKATGYSIVNAVELRRLHAQCGTLRSEKARIQTQANQYHDQLDKLRAAHERAVKGKDSAYEQLGDWVNRAREMERIAEGALFFGLEECERWRELCVISDALRVSAVSVGDANRLDFERLRDRDDAMRVALTKAGVPLTEELPYDARTPEHLRTAQSLDGVERIKRLAAERDAAIARAEKAEAAEKAAAECFAVALKERDSAREDAAAAKAREQRALGAAKHLASRNAGVPLASGRKLGEGDLVVVVTESRLAELETFLQQVAEAVGAIHVQSEGPDVTGSTDEILFSVRELMSERDALRDEIADIKAPVDGEPTCVQMAEAYERQPGSIVKFAVDQWRVAFRAGRDNLVKDLYEFAPSGLLQTCDREQLGQLVREVWVAWAKEQPNPKLSWLAPWEGLSEPDKEVDRRIGERLFHLGAGACIAWSLSDEPAVEGEAGTSAEVNGVSDGAYAFLWRSGFTAGVNKVKQVAAMFMDRPLARLKQPTDAKLEEVHKMQDVMLQISNEDRIQLQIPVNYRTAYRDLFNFGVEHGLNQLREAIDEVADGHVAPKATVDGESK